MRLFARAFPLLLALPLAAADAPPAKKPLTLEAISSPAAMAAFRGGMTGTAWRDAGHFTWVEREGEGERAVMALFEWNVATGKKAKLLDPIPVPAKEPPKEGEKPKTLPLAGYAWNKAGTALLLQGEDDLWLYDLAKKSLTRLTEDAEEEEHPTFSPDGGRVAFVKKGDIWVVDVTTRKAQRLTTDGSETIYNGHLDWVYEEELDNRRGGRAYEWAPDGKALAYLKLDERPVPEALIVDFLPAHAKLEPQRYPKAGDPNPVPSVHIVALDGGAGQDVAFPGEDLLVGPELSWTRDGKSLCYLVLDRVQTKVDVRLLGRDGKRTTLLSETDPAWINSVEAPDFLADGTFLFLSERTGFLHAYRYRADGRLLNAVTKGDWMLDRGPEVDEKGGWLYLVATEKDPRERHVYRVRLDGTDFTRLTQGRGTHGIRLAPGGAHWLETANDLTTPTRTVLRRADGKEVAVVHEMKNRFADEYALGTAELGSFRGKDGTLFYTKLVKPADFDPAKKYPVVVDVYGGPHAQTVRDAYGVANPFDHLMAARGFLVFGMDNRGSWGRGHAFETPLLKKTGERELADQLEGVAWLKSLPFVDGSRIGITGGSYGGYMTLYAVTHAPDTFRAAVAISSVTDWKYYDSIYTERYMKLPKDNAEGYKASSVVESAKELKARLLILHGTSDDNVHLQNSIAFADAAMRAKKEFDFLPFARQKHGFRDPALRLYSLQATLDFFQKNL